MVSIPSLWLPILLSAVAVFVASSLIHMVLPYHKSDYKRLPSEDGVMGALRSFDLPPGDYMFPMANAGDMKNPAFVEKWSKGPAGSMTVLPKGPWSMGRNLSLWFLYSVVVGITAATSPGARCRPGRVISRSSASRAPPRSTATRWLCGRTRSGTRRTG